MIDDLAGVADVCAERGLWLHVDGAYGLGRAVRAERARALRRHRARRLAHRRPAQVAVRAVRLLRAALPRARPAGRAAHRQNASYLDALLRATTAWNPSDYGVHLTRRARGLPFWFSLAVHGTDAYAEARRAHARRHPRRRRGDPRAAGARAARASPSCPCSSSAAAAGRRRTTSAGAELLRAGTRLRAADAPWAASRAPASRSSTRARPVEDLRIVLDTLGGSRTTCRWLAAFTPGRTRDSPCMDKPSRSPDPGDCRPSCVASRRMPHRRQRRAGPCDPRARPGRPTSPSAP